MKISNGKIITTCGECSHCKYEIIEGHDYYFCEPEKPKYGSEPVTKDQRPSVNCRLPDCNIRTFQEWNDLGYKIVKGEKSHRMDGKAMFFDNQVTKKKTRILIDEDGSDFFDEYENREPDYLDDFNNWDH